eukprot:jgi/Botrbrau1/59/Bobra.0022s0053.1
MLFLGGAAVLNALTNMNIYAAAFLMPLGVVIYTVAGLKATFLSSYLHTVIIYVALCIFSVKVYIAGPHLGSPAKVWENLVALSAKYPVAGNREGSYLTMYSKGGLMFGTHPPLHPSPRNPPPLSSQPVTPPPLSSLTCNPRPLSSSACKHLLVVFSPYTPSLVLFSPYPSSLVLFSP